MLLRLVQSWGCGRAIANQSLAHAYEGIAKSSDCGNYINISDVLQSKNNYGYYCRRTRRRQEFAYRFNEYNPSDKTKPYPRFTNQTITASAGEFLTYLMVGNPHNQPNGDVLFNTRMVPSMAILPFQEPTALMTGPPMYIEASISHKRR